MSKAIEQRLVAVQRSMEIGMTYVAKQGHQTNERIKSKTKRSDISDVI